MKIKKFIWLIINIGITVFLRENLNVLPQVTFPLFFGMMFILVYNIANIFFKVD